MKRALYSLFSLTIAAVMTSQVTAAPVTYNFTGSRVAGNSGFFGATVSGTITLDLAAVPSTPAASATDGVAEWRNVPNIKITAVATNFNAGTASNVLVDETVLQQSQGLPEYMSWNLSWIGFDQLDGSDVKQISVVGAFPPLDLNTITAPSTATYLGQPIFLDLFDATNRDSYTLSFAPSAANLTIGGLDTGIADFNYQGQPVSQILAGYAAGAKNHGSYVEKVEKLAAKLVKAKLLTKTQAKALTQAAAKSNIGKKPKKDKKDKEDEEDEEEDD